MSDWPTCDKCGTRIDPEDPALLREIIGWAKHRDAGGQNHVIGRVETGRLMCGTCATRLRAGLPVESQPLFG